MFVSGSLFPTRKFPMLLLFAAVILSGCSSKQEQALDQAKKQAAATGQAQQIVSVDKNGNTTTTVVQPPTAGQNNQAITTTVTPVEPGAPVPAFAAPTVSAVVQPVSIPAGTSLTIRIDQRISVKSSRAGDTFTGEMVEPVLASDNSVLDTEGSTGSRRDRCGTSPRTFQRQIAARAAVDHADDEWNRVSAGDTRHGAQQERQGQTFNGLDCWRFGAGDARGWLGHWRRRAGRGRTGGWRCWNRGRGTDWQPRHRDTRGVDCSLQSSGRSGGAAGIAAQKYLCLVSYFGAADFTVCKIARRGPSDGLKPAP